MQNTDGRCATSKLPSSHARSLETPSLRVALPVYQTASDICKPDKGGRGVVVDGMERQHRMEM